MRDRSSESRYGTPAASRNAKFGAAVAVARSVASIVSQLAGPSAKPWGAAIT
jgi:hypothetical protein